MSPRGDVRAQILEAAAELLLDQGFEETSLDEVRKRAGVSNGSLYHHYPSKSQLARALYEDALRHYHAALLREIADDVAAADAVRGLVGAHIAWIGREPRRARMLHELRRTSAIAAAEADWGALNAEAFAALRAFCERQTEAGELRPMPFAVWLALVFAPVLQLSPRWAAGEKLPPPRVRALLADAAWAAVAPP